MKKIISFYFILCSLCKCLPTFDVCGENNGNFQISEAVLWENRLLFFMENRTAFWINDFKWNGSHFTVGHISEVLSFVETFEEPISMAFVVDYPMKGPQIVATFWYSVCITPLVLNPLI